MQSFGRNDPCPCGSGRKFKQCCGPAVAGAVWPVTPEALMRSRYTAYVTGAVDYLYRTTHPDNPAVKGVDPARFARETLAYCRQAEFTRLTVRQNWPPDGAGVARVLFTAHYRTGGEADAFTELSDFVQDDQGRWLYHSGCTPD